VSVSSSGPDRPHEGGTFGPYRLGELLGEGAMAQVFRASAADGSEVALKILKTDLAGDDTYRRRFVHEARAASGVRDDHLVPILDAGEVEGQPYLAVAYVAGRTLAERLADEGALPRVDVVRVALELAAGVDALHGAGLVHRDIKSSNILLAADGSARLTDFGLARGPGYTALTRPGQVVGTLHYLAPELIRGEAATPASDVYALGCTVYECVAGRTPFGGRSIFQVGTGHLDDEPEDPGIGRADWHPTLSRAVLLALRKDPATRPASAGAYARGIRAAADLL
jgi:serine/threonine-protein kinase